MSVLIETTLGNLVIDLYVDQCPKACLNFVKLCKIKYYNFSLFHRVEAGFTAQTGDALDGSGGSSIFGILHGETRRLFAQEHDPDLKFNRRGLVGMTAAHVEGGEHAVDASNEPVKRIANGSQFFITLGEDLTYLDNRHTLFGEVVEGLDVLDKLEKVLVDEQLRPFQDIRIKHTYILDDPFPDPAGLSIPDRSPGPTRELLSNMRLLDDDLTDADSALPEEERDKQRREKEAKAQSLTLEMLGDLPFAEIKPPENILFVAKLNPVTRSEDLQLIFSRFGKINSCQVIKDHRTGKSLQYAFVEFDEREACEEAYFKMQNVLIDDRRIHVDFSQSVSKLHGQWIQQREKSNANHGKFGRGLEAKRHYRSEVGRGHSASQYDLVLDHQPTETVKERQRHRERSPSPRGSGHYKRLRSRSRSRDRYRQRSRSRDRRRPRSRSRSRERKHRHHHSSRRY